MRPSRVTLALLAASLGLLPGGAAAHRELELHVEAGLAPARVLQIATLGAARVMGLEHDLGLVAPGKLADLILVDGDPLADIASIRRVETVVRDGTWFDAGAVYELLGVRPAVTRR